MNECRTNSYLREDFDEAHHYQCNGHDSEGFRTNEAGKQGNEDQLQDNLREHIQGLPTESGNKFIL